MFKLLFLIVIDILIYKSTTSILLVHRFLFILWSLLFLVRKEVLGCCPLSHSRTYRPFLYHIAIIIIIVSLKLTQPASLLLLLLLLRLLISPILRVIPIIEQQIYSIVCLICQMLSDIHFIVPFEADLLLLC